MPKWNRVGRLDFFKFRNRYYIDWTSHWGLFGLVLKLYGVKFIPFWANTGKIPNKIRLSMTSPVFQLAFSGTIKRVFLFFFFWGGVKLRLVVGRGTVQKHVFLFCLTSSKKTSTDLTLAKPSRCRISMFRCNSRLSRKPIISLTLLTILYWNIFVVFCVVPKVKTKIRPSEKYRLL